ncbi:MAG: hydrogenase maturation protease [Candidatus Methanomethylicia archaeon]
MGIGNDLRRDDSAGLRVVKILSGKLKKDAFIRILECGEVPENFLGTIENFSPSHVIIIDAVDMKSIPGSIGFFKREDILDFTTISTHNISPQIMFTYLEDIIKAKVLLIGIQTMNIGFGENLSDEVDKSVKFIANVIIEVLSDEKIASDNRMG